MPFTLIAGIALLLSLVSFPTLAAPTVTTSDPIPNAGYFTLSWSQPAAATDQIELQQSTDERFEPARTLYLGRDGARVLSGVANGSYFYRARVVHDDGSPGPWGETTEVQVAHHSLNRALAFFALGAVVFLATLALIVTAGRTSDHD